jgi:hypothetical protein
MAKFGRRCPNAENRKTLKKYSAAISMALLLALAACSHRGGGNLTNNYHDGHLGSYKHHNQ